MSTAEFRASVINRFKSSIAKKREWKNELEKEYAERGETVNVVFL